MKRSSEEERKRERDASTEVRENGGYTMIRKRLGGVKREAKRRTVPVSKRPKDEQKKKRGSGPLYRMKSTRTTRTLRRLETRKALSGRIALEEAGKNRS